MRVPFAALLLGALLALPALAEEPAAEAPPAESPATVEGLWCGTGPLREFSLRLRQQQQDVEGELVRRDRSRTIEGRIEGDVLRTQSTRVGALVLQKQGEELKVTDGDGPLALVRGQSFRRSNGDSCTG